MSDTGSSMTGSAQAWWDMSSEDTNEPLVLAVSVIPVVDMLNGMAATYGVPLLGISLAYKTLLMMTIVSVLLTNSRHYGGFILAFLAIVGVWCVCALLLSRSLHGEDFVWLFRVLFAYALLLVVQSYPLHLRKYFLVRIAKWWFFLFVANQLIGAMGIGRETYRGGVGTSGFYYAPNEFAPALSLAFAIYFWGNRDSRSASSGFTIWLLYAISSFLLATRLALGMVVLNSLLAVSSLLILTFQRHVSRIVSHAITYLLLIGVGVIVAFGVWSKFAATGVAQSWVANFEQHQGNLLGFILSSRNEFFITALEQFRAESPNSLLIGSRTPLVEMDLFDIPFRYGFILPVCVAMLFVSTFRYGRHESESDQTTVVPPVVLWAIVAYGLFWGHVVFSATVMPLLLFTVSAIVASRGAQNR